MGSTQAVVVDLWVPARGFGFLARWLEPRPHGREHDRLHASAALDWGSGTQKVGPALASNIRSLEIAPCREDLMRRQVRYSLAG